jgi:hypothetical protein
MPRSARSDDDSMFVEPTLSASIAIIHDMRQVEVLIAFGRVRDPVDEIAYRLKRTPIAN